MSTREGLRASGFGLRPEALILVALVGCHGRRAHDDAPPAPKDSAIDAASAWPELESFPKIEPDHVVTLPIDRQKPRGEVVGPVLLGETAVVASSQLGFVAIDIQRGQIAWKKPAGTRVAPPIASGGDLVLVGDCADPEDVPAGERLLGCMRTVTPTGSDVGYVAIHGSTKDKDLAAFAVDPSPQDTWLGAGKLVWRRGTHALSIDLVSGAASPASSAADPPLVIHHKQRTWLVTRTDDGMIVARDPSGKEAWKTTRTYGTLLGALYIPEQSPMIRLSRAGHYGGHPELLLFDIDATGSLNGQVAMPVPGGPLLAHAIDAVGNTALAVRLDASNERDFIVGYAANALIMYVYPLPRTPRADPIGLAVAPDAVVVFHDGDQFTILPELSAPPTAPGAARVMPENSTP